ncbi:MAG: T9SS type A sorting domain-containing protein [Bacteroidota bacterium]|nr:T9SS type A sorting domain-containing protein [Bacteroidota bacterium]
MINDKAVLSYSGLPYLFSHKNCWSVSQSFRQQITKNLFLQALGSAQFCVQNAEPLESNTFLYPNPSAGAVTLRIASDKTNPESEIMIYSATGQLVYDEMNSNGVEMQMDLSAFANGVYFVRVKTGEHISEKKIIINK